MAGQTCDICMCVLRLVLSPFYSSVKMLSRFCTKFHIRSRKMKKAAFWGTTIILCMLVMMFNDVTLRMMQTSFENPGKEYVVESVNARFPKALAHEENEIEPSDLDLPVESDPGVDLLPDLAPDTLHYIWCGSRFFEFKHYLALKSAVRVLKPDKIVFHYDVLPLKDEEEYYSWFPQIMENMPHMTLRKLTDTACHTKGSGRYLLVMSLLHEMGGIYVPEDAILVDFPIRLRSRPLVTGIYAQSETEFMDGLMVAQRLSFTKPETQEQLQVVMTQGREEHGGLRSCDSERYFNRDRKGEVVCVILKRDIFPKDIWTGKGRFNTLARMIMYGTRTIRPDFDRNSKIPQIAHYVSLEDPFISFTGYLSMLSSIYVAGFQKVYVHGPLVPQGKWWKRLADDNRYVFVHHEFPENEDGKEMPVHMANIVMRSDILLKYGGVYNDYNVLWTQQIPSGLFTYDAVASPDWHMYGSWPESLNHGTLMAKRGSKYIKLFKQMIQNSKNKDYWFIDHYLAYRVLELNPSLLHLDPHLQVKCLNHNCHPTWQGDYRSRPIQNKPGRPFSWKNETLSLHWVDNFPALDADMVKYTSGMVIDISRHVLRQAGIAIMDL